MILVCISIAEHQNNQSLQHDEFAFDAKRDTETNPAPAPSPAPVPVPTPKIDPIPSPRPPAPKAPPTPAPKAPAPKAPAPKAPEPTEPMRILVKPPRPVDDRPEFLAVEELKTQTAKLYFRDGRAYSTKVWWKPKAGKVETTNSSYKFDTVACIDTSKDGYLIYSPANKAFARVKQAKFVNYTALPVTVTLHSAWTFQDREVEYHSDVEKNNFQKGVDVFAETLAGRRLTSDTPHYQWTLSPGEEASLPLFTNRVAFSTQTEHGKLVCERGNTRVGSEFVIAIDDKECHSPLLVKVGEWKVEQDVSYTQVRGRTPDTAVTTPITGLFSGKVTGYETRYYPGSDYEYTRENNGGIATASAEIENKTDKALSVSVTLQFDFTALVLSHQKVSTELELPARSKGIVRLTVNTKGFIDNRKATGVKQIDITTTVK